MPLVDTHMRRHGCRYGNTDSKCSPMLLSREGREEPTIYSELAARTSAVLGIKKTMLSKVLD